MPVTVENRELTVDRARMRRHFVRPRSYRERDAAQCVTFASGDMRMICDQCLELDDMSVRVMRRRTCVTLRCRGSLVPVRYVAACEWWEEITEYAIDDAQRVVVVMVADRWELMHALPQTENEWHTISTPALRDPAIDALAAQYATADEIPAGVHRFSHRTKTLVTITERDMRRRP